ncbi:Copper-containing nitrite reductase [Fusarium oxysporum f. sp. raphani]|uniref:Copper-containing nitrite reductase n=1 Tax=Fusarium oxysporum f. sp. raphani TaxID=96318 RepID=A0A8J5PBS3_FUSOX|nr:Copper-containing nitrite reductase [Fusarium oxysporum f. sp. raphani]
MGELTDTSRGCIRPRDLGTFQQGPGLVYRDRSRQSVYTAFAANLAQEGTAGIQPLAVMLTTVLLQAIRALLPVWKRIRVLKPSLLINPIREQSLYPTFGVCPSGKPSIVLAAVRGGHEPVSTAVAFESAGDEITEISSLPREVAVLTSAPNVPPPITRKHPVLLQVALATETKLAQLTSQYKYEQWTFNGTVPGPFIRARVGDVVELTLTNKDPAGNPHNIDCHAFTGPGGGAAVTTVEENESKTARFKLLYPGLYFYHCAAAPVPVHIANGMYGLMYVQPEEDLPPVDKEYYVMQSEFYHEPPEIDDDGRRSDTVEFSYPNGLREEPNIITFNGSESALTRDKPLKANVGDSVRIFFGNAGPNLTSAFHVIGSHFKKVYRDGDVISPPGRAIQTITVPPGSASIVDLKIFGLPFQQACCKHLETNFKRSRVYIIASASLSKNTSYVDQLKSALDGLVVGVRIGISPHTPISEIVDILADVKDLEVDCIVTLGAGSITDGAKLVRFAFANQAWTEKEIDTLWGGKSHNPNKRDVLNEPTIILICIPTSLSGAEYQAIAGATDTKSKAKRIFEPMLGPNLVIQDPQLATATPQKTWLSSGIRAVDHCVEILCSLKSNVVADEWAARGLDELISGLLSSKHEPEDLDARHLYYPEKHLQAELGPKRRKTKGHRAYVCLHCQNPPWSNRVPGNAIHHAETAHRALIRASEAANDTPSTFASGVSSGAIDSYIVSRPSQAALRNCFNKQAYIEAVVGLLTRRRLPFSAVEHSELRDLALACNPAIGDLLINDRKQAMGYINSNYSLYSSQLAERLQTTQSKIHISSDLWASPHRHGVLAVCVQWVDEDFKLQKALLGLPECKYSHSGATQAELIAGTLRKFNITAQSLGYYIGDNATSNDTCLEELSKVLEAESGAEYPHKRRRIRCIGHIINLALQAFLLARSKEALRAALEATADEPGSTMLEEFSQQLHELDPAEIAAHSDTTTHQEQRQEERQEQPTRKPTHARGKRATTTHQQASNVDERFAGWQGIPALAKLHALAVYIRSSALHNDQWSDAVGKQLGIDNITRWSSWHRVITIALKKKPQIIQFTAEHDNDLEGSTLSSRDWEMLERTLEFLQPFYEATLEAEGAMSSISQSLELLDLLLGHCEKWKAHYSQPSNRDDRIIHSIDMCWFILDKYYTMTEDVPVYAAALLLDPSKRKSYIEECWPEEWHEGAFAAARSLWKEEYDYDVEIHLSEQSLAVPALLKRKKDTMLSKMRLEVRNKTMARARGKDDFDSFISEAPIALAEDTTPLQWWCSEDVRTAYPRLSRMAIDILSVPAESAEPERTFSGARRTARWDRLRLLIESIEKIECIGNWLREGHIRPSAEGGIGLPCDPEAIEGDI